MLLLIYYIETDENMRVLKILKNVKEISSIIYKENLYEVRKTLWNISFKHPFEEVQSNL